MLMHQEGRATPQTRGHVVKVLLVLQGISYWNDMKHF